MELPGDNFFSTTAQVIATLVLAFAVEARLLDVEMLGFRWRAAAIGFLVAALQGIVVTFGALLGNATLVQLYGAVCGLLAAGGLVLIPVIASLARDFQKHHSRLRGRPGYSEWTGWTLLSLLGTGSLGLVLLAAAGYFQ